MGVSEKALVLKGITKRFPLVLANDHIDLDLNWGEVLALVGENGAGKSTLMKIVYGLQPPDEGEMWVDGRPYRPRSPLDAIRAGIGMVHQHFMLVEPFTVLENLVLGLEPGSPFRMDLDQARREASALMEALGFHVPLDEKVEDLPVGLQQRVEILKALYRKARILILDEPTAVLTPQEAEELFRFLRAYVEKGNAAIFISHKLKEVLEVSDRTTVIRDGKVVGTVQTPRTSLEELARMMVGREVVLRVEKGPARPGEVVLEVENLAAPPRLKGVSFRVRAGEIVGVAGVEGNGQTELVEALTGLRPHTGRVLYLGEPLPPTARKVRERGVSHIPEDRNQRGLVLDFTTRENAILGDHHRPPFRGFLDFLQPEAVEAHAQTLVERFDVRPRSTALAARRYSGGNAQKIVVGREILRRPRLLVAAQPTRGVDIGAIEAIHKELIRARDEGLAVLLVSADLSEVLSLSDRILVMYEGRIMGELTPEEATEERLGLLMAGISPETRR
ncbi:ABC transporter ATP-binding protein [Thermus filiformis]|uniref:Heme ABC transporter ATP-binding protein n=1 Tax=Thermus filiformis TaxID=276 RepID=A0A0A2X9W5_THEFI|nr:ABC transporter ATP-binding protein [Thermus filiformis]KGQ21989.2 heme ABC transporter ATP-binding protein [Thermus filiformis]